MSAGLLPQNATPLEKALADSGDMLDLMGAEPEKLKAFKFKTWGASLEPAMMAEWGFDKLLAFTSAKSLVLAHGTEFYRKRGTPRALVLALIMLAMGGSLEEVPLRWRRWNRFQAQLAELPAAELPDLLRAESLIQFSAAERSRFVRGFKGYDIRVAETSFSKTSQALLSDWSGVRLEGGTAKWSFGRVFEDDHTLSQGELQALGVWIAPSTDPFTWANANFPWSMANFAWNTPVNTVRKAIMLALIQRLSCWIEFKTAGGTLIGYRKAKAKLLVKADAEGPFLVGSQNYADGTYGDELLYVEALTDFADGFGAIAATAALRFGAAPKVTEKPGLLWATAAQLDLPLAAVASRNVSIDFKRSYRESVRSLLRIA